MMQQCHHSAFDAFQVPALEEKSPCYYFENAFTNIYIMLREKPHQKKLPG